MSDLGAKMAAIAEQQHVRDVIVRRFVTGTWSVIVYRDSPLLSIEGKGGTLDEAMRRANEFLLDVAA